MYTIYLIVSTIGESADDVEDERKKVSETLGEDYVVVLGDAA